MVVDFEIEDNKRYAVGYKCIDITDFFTIPMRSSLLKIFKYSNTSQIKEKFLITDITHKLFRMPCEGFFVIIPLVHGAFHSFNYSSV